MRFMVCRDEPAVLAALRALTDKVEQSKVELDTQGIGNAFYGF